MKNFIQINRALVAKKKIFTFFLALAASVGTMFATTKSMTPNAVTLSWDKNNQQWGITAYDDGGNSQLVFTFAIDGDKTTLPTSMTLSNNTDGIFVFSDTNDDSFGDMIKNAAIAISYDGTGYQYDNVGGVYYVNAKISGSVSGANGNTLTINEPANFIKVFVPGPEEIYAVWEAGTTTLTLYYDDNRISKGGETDWSSHKDAATTVVLDGSMTAARPTSTASWFSGFEKVTEIQNIEFLNTSEVTSMSSMFASCKALSSLDVSHFNTANVTSMKMMFYLCSILTTLDLSNFNIGKVTNISNMFYYCRKLQTIYCDDDWSASTALTDATGVFVNCDALVGGNGTAYNNSNPNNATYARPDEPGNPGYFTKKTATALDQVPSAQGQSTKFLRNGNLFILRGDKTYTITGQAVK